MSEQASEENATLDNQSSDQEANPLGGSDLEQATKLLTGLSRHELQTLYERIEERAKFVDHVSGTLGDAILKASDSDSFQSAIAPVVASGVLKTARREPMEMGKAIAPALGPAIRGMVALALENMNQRIDAHIQTNFSIQGFKWRMESKKTGVPLADIVMRETLDFRVDHILLIHQHSGTLLQEASQPDISTKDPAVVSSMLTAVSDFVVDAFGAENTQDEAQTYKVGDLTAYVERLGDLALAAVVRGTVSPQLKHILRERLESICVIFGETAHNFDGDITPFAATESMLKDCLISRAKKKTSDNNKKSSGRIYAGILLLILALIVGWLSYQAKLAREHQANLQDFAQALRNWPGATLVDFSFQNPFAVTMLVDPLAEDPSQLAEKFGYSQDEIHWQLQPYVSLEPHLIDARFQQRLVPPITADYLIQDGVIYFSGGASHSWLQKAKDDATSIPGINFADFSEIRDLSLDRFNQLKRDIEATDIYFTYAQVGLMEQGKEAIEQLKPKLDEFEKLSIELNRPVDFYADIDPLKLSDYAWKDDERTEKRVENLSERLGRRIQPGRFDIVHSDKPFPYARLRVEYPEQ